MVTDVEALIAAMAEMREVIAEAHGVRKDLERTLREAREFLAKELEGEVANQMNAVVKEQVDALGTSIEKAMDDCTNKVISEFDKLFKMLTGATREMQRQGKVSIPEMIDLLSEFQDSPFGPIRRERK